MYDSKFLLTRLTLIESELAAKQTELERIKALEKKIDIIKESLSAHYQNRRTYNEERNNIPAAFKQHVTIETQEQRRKQLINYQTQLPHADLMTALTYYQTMVEEIALLNPFTAASFKSKFLKLKSKLEWHMNQVTKVTDQYTVELKRVINQDRSPDILTKMLAIEQQIIKCNTVYAILDSAHSYLKGYDDCSENIRANEQHIQFATNAIQNLSNYHQRELKQTHDQIHHYELEITQIKQDLAALESGGTVTVPQFIALADSSIGSVPVKQHSTASAKIFTPN